MYHILLLHSVCLLAKLLKTVGRRISRERERSLSFKYKKNSQEREGSEGRVCGGDQDRKIKNEILQGVWREEEARQETCTSERKTM